MKVFGGKIGEESEVPVSPRPTMPATVPSKATRRHVTRAPIFPEAGAKPTVEQHEDHVFVTLSVLGAGLRPCDLTVRVNADRSAALLWDQQLFATARWVGSGLSHLYGTDGGDPVPRSANAPASHIVEKAIMEIEFAAQASVRSLLPAAPARPRAVTSVTISPDSPKPAEPEPWQEPSDMDEALSKREELRCKIVQYDADLAAVNAKIDATPSGAGRSPYRAKRAQIIRDRMVLVAEVQRLKAWCHSNGFTGTSPDKAPLWELLRDCYKMLERMTSDETPTRDDIEACLDRIEYYVPRRYLNEQ